MSRAPALQHRDFRLIWFGQGLSVVGAQMQLIAMDWHIYRMLQGQSVAVELFGRSVDLSAAALGLGSMGLVRVIPIVFFALVGGMIADSRDRRRVMLVTQSLSALFALMLAIITFTGNISLAAIYLLTAAAASAAAFDNPARQSLVPNLVPREHLTSAVSLNSVVFQLATVIGPAIGGVLIGRFDVGLLYLLNALSFVGVIVALLLMQYRGKPVPLAQGLGWRSVVEGLRYVRGSPIIWSTMLLDFVATLFASARTMLPLVAGEILRVGPEGFGLLATAQPIGSLIAGGIVALRRQIQRQGVVLLVAVALYGLTTALFGLSTLFALSYVLYALTGASDTVSTVIRGTLRQLTTPDHLRGRMTSINMIFFMGGPQLGEVRAGLMASALGVPFALVSGGIATVLLTGWVAWQYPRLRRYTLDEQVVEAASALAPATPPPP